jgi:transcriptional regulator with XRE-family HTH domain
MAVLINPAGPIKVSYMVTRIGAKKLVRLYILEWRQHRNEMSQQQLASLIGSTKSSVSRWETGERDITTRALGAIARALDCEVADLYQDPSKTNIVATRFKTDIKPPQQFFREWRKHREMTLEQAAEKAGMTAGNISAMERGAQGYTPGGLQALAEVYETSPGWLLEFNPLERNSPDLLSIWGKATDSQRKMIVKLARTVVSSRDA